MKINYPNTGYLRPKISDHLPIIETRKSTSSLSSLSSDSTVSTWKSSSNSSLPSPTSLKRDRQLPLRSRNVDLSKYLNRTNGTNLILTIDQISCCFCKNNGEKDVIYNSHALKDSLGKVICPILREYVCPKCGESGDYAHTNKYCPETQRKHKESKIKRCFNHSD
jgi:hypothetical protein